MNSNRVYIALAGILVLITAACSKKEESREMLRPVRYIIAQPGDARQVRTFSGMARVGSDVSLSFRNSGIIVEKNVTKGQSVRKGQLLGRLDTVEAQLDYEKAVSEVDRAASEMFTAETNFSRIKSLYEQGAKPLVEYESAKNAYNSAKSLYETALRNQEIQKSKVSYGYIYSPTDGMVLRTKGDVNERIAAGDEFVVLSASDDEMKVAVQLPESVINSISLGMTVEIHFPALPNEIFEGKITEISPGITEESATYPVDIQITNPSDQIKPGMAAKVTFVFIQEASDAKSKLILPLQSVGEDAKGNFIYVLKSEDEKTGKVIKKQIEVGALTSSGFEILSGLSEGDSVVTAGLQTLLDGQKVGLQ